jgi:DNA topoisomerase-1
MPRLRYVDGSSPGLSRRRRGSGFEYLDAEGCRIVNSETLERIRSLVIPPAWRDVWICTVPNGHLQATGTDAAGRRQYLYHPAWRAIQDRSKFDRMVKFARSLPTLRAAVADQLKASEPTREAVLACAVRLLDQSFLRIGTETYAEENGTFGLATLRKGHVKLDRPDAVLLDFASKGGKRRRQRIVDADVYALVARLKARRGGKELLAYKEDGHWQDVKSAEINEYIKVVLDGDFTAKDFRTWHATVLAAVAVSVYGRPASSRSARARVVNQSTREVAHYLGNTPAVCRASYIDPRVFERYGEGRTIATTLEDLEEIGSREPQARVERSVLRLLTGQTKR